MLQREKKNVRLLIAGQIEKSQRGRVPSRLVKKKEKKDREAGWEKKKKGRLPAVAGCSCKGKEVRLTKSTAG